MDTPLQEEGSDPAKGRWRHPQGTQSLFTAARADVHPTARAVRNVRSTVRRGTSARVAAAVLQERVAPRLTVSTGPTVRATLRQMESTGPSVRATLRQTESAGPSVRATLRQTESAGPSVRAILRQMESADPSVRAVLRQMENADPSTRAVLPETAE